MGVETLGRGMLGRMGRGDGAVAAKPPLQHQPLEDVAKTLVLIQNISLSSQSRNETFKTFVPNGYSEKGLWWNFPISCPVVALIIYRVI